MIAHIFAALLIAQAAGKTPAEVRDDFRALLDRPRAPLDVEDSPGDAPASGLIARKVLFTSEIHPDGRPERVPGLLVKRADGPERRPAVIVLHGTGGVKEGERSWLVELARRGFVAIAIDGRAHGERAGGKAGAAAYNRAIIDAWRSRHPAPQVHPLYYDTCWDVWRTIDYLQARPDVDPGRIGLLGTSKGGIEAWMAGAADERIKVAVPLIATQSFAYILAKDRWQGRAGTVGDAHKAAAADLGKAAVDADVCRALWGKLVPGIVDEYDCPSMLRLFAGRPLLVVNGRDDPINPVEGAEIAVEVARSAFERAGCPEMFRAILVPGVGHQVRPAERAEAVEWLARWLRPG